jgi:hypothetical protein
LPWLLVLVDEIVVRQRRSPVWLGVALGVIAAAQVLIGEELFAGAVLLGGLLLVVLVAMHPRPAAGRVRYAMTAFAVSVVVFEALLVLPLNAQLTVPARVQSDITEEVHGSSDLLAVVTPSRLSAIAPDAAVRFGDRFLGTKETYLGLPLLLVVVAVVVIRRRSLVVRVGFAMLLVCMVLSLGSRLRVGGRTTFIQLPSTVVESLPLLQNMVPSRLALFTALFAGLLLAAALEGWWRDGGWRRALAVVTAGLVLAFLAPPAPLPSAPVATPPFFTTPAVHMLPRDGVALVVPFPQKGRANQAMVWQAEAGMRFKMPGGYFVGPDPDGGVLHEAPPTTTALALGRIQRGGRPPELTPALRRQIAEDLARWEVGSVVLGPMSHRRIMAGFLTELLGRPPERLAGVEVWGDATVAPIIGGT